MWSYNKNSRNQLYYWCNWLLHITICALPTKREAIAWTIEPDAWWELSLWEELFRSHKKLKRCGGFFFDVFGVVMTVYMNWKNTLALMLQKKIKRKIKQMSKQQQQKNFLCSSECNVQFQSYRGVQTCEKKNMKKIKNGFNVCFQNKANVPITIISCGVCLKPDRNILSLWNTRQFPIIMLIFHWIHHETTHVWFYYNSCPMTVGIDCSACRDPEVD